MVNQDYSTQTIPGETEAEAKHEGEQGASRRPPLVNVSADGLWAYLTLYEVPGGYSEQEIRDALAKAGVVEGVDWALLASLATDGATCEALPIAEGRPAEPSTDAYIEYLFKTVGHNLEEHGGRINWHELNFVQSVEAGTIVARKHPAVPGKSGVSVRAKAMPCKPPRDARLKLGKGVEISEHDPNVVIATVSGAVRLDGSGKLGVDDLYVVNGNLDFSVGNMDYLGSIVINGDVQPGFEVKAAGDVEVKGIIEAATVIAGGSVSGKSIIGEGSHIEAHGDITARFADNAFLKAGTNVRLQYEAVNCHVEAGAGVFVGGSNPSAGGIMGGDVSAAQEIVVFKVGGIGGAKTKLRVGYDWLVPTRLATVEREIEEQQLQLKKVDDALKRLAASQSELSNVAAIGERLSLTRHSLTASLSGLERQRMSWRKSLQLHGSIIARGPIRAGTELTVDGKTRILLEDRFGERFVNEGQSVISVGLKGAPGKAA